MDIKSQKKKFYRYIHLINSLLSGNNKLDEQTYVELSNLLEDLEEGIEMFDAKNKILFKDCFKIIKHLLCMKNSSVNSL